MSLDEDGRVIRLDSTSKFLAPGMRIGWVTAPEKFIDKYILLQEISVNVRPCRRKHMLILFTIRIPYP
ncbi:hypothetical protein EON65_33455 [archaeon]|nr:MAG: hypothetical protein EON65_33455 [archaeon]